MRNFKEYKEEARNLTMQALARFAKGDSTALRVGKQRLIGLKQHFKNIPA
jgi:hypothetical protein